MIAVLLFAGFIVMALIYIRALREIDRANEMEERLKKIFDDERRIREVTDKIIAERRSKEDAEKRLDGGTF